MARPATATNGLKLFRTMLWAMVVVAALAAAGLYFWRPPVAPAGLTGAPFTLEATTGGSFTEASLKGPPTLLFFGYTFCPDVCPTTLAELTAIRQQLKLSPAQLRIVFASVDPERDTLAQLQSYLSGFGTPIIGLTGTPAQVDGAEAAFGIYSKKEAADSSGSYVVDHTASVFLLDRAGKFAGTIAYGEDQATVTDKIRRLVST